MGTRLELQTLLETVYSEFGTEPNKHVYFQPPATGRMNYPCIVYSLDGMDITHADNRPYIHKKTYAVTVIDRNPDSAMPDRIAALPTASFKSRFVTDNLYHTVFRLYF